MGIKFRAGVVALIGALLASCGGGGGGDGGTVFPSSNTVTIDVGQTQTTPRSLVNVTVAVRLGTGGPAPNGTEVVLQVSPLGSGVVTFSDASVVNGVIVHPTDRAVGTVAGGVANFRFHSRSVGTAVLTASASVVGSSTPTPNATRNINVVAGPPSDPRLRLTTATLNLPPNSFGVDPFIGSPYMSEVVVTWRRLNGDLVTTVPTTPIRFLVTNVSVNPVNPSGGFTTLDDPETLDDPSTTIIENNEFLTRIGQGPVDMVAGLGTFFVHSGNVPHQFVVTVTALDPDTDETLEASLTFNTASTTLPLPSTISLTRLGQPVYLGTSGGNTTDQLIANVLDGSNLFVPDPRSGSARWNNVRFEIVGGAQGGERLRGIAANGAQVTGSSISSSTNQGIAQVAFESGTRQGSVRVRAVADRADNNVDNGISEPIESFMDITVSDGRLYDIDITSPASNSLNVNGTDDNAAPDTNEPDPDGTYSLTISAVGTDRLGNPVLPGTEIRFGKIDEPLERNAFVIADDDGDPQEGNVGFFDVDGGFTTRGGGVGPGDTVIVFGEEVVGNRDLEGARTVQSVNSQSSITVTRRFNLNDTTGTSVNSGPILPYVVGRSADGNIDAVGYTDRNGVARTKLNYPVSKLGKLAAVYAQGSGDIINNVPELVTDAELFRFAGVGDATLTASPSSIPGNRTVSIDVCHEDGLGNPISGSFVNFAFSNLNGGTGTVDGVSTGGTTADPTGPDGCVTVEARTVGMVPPATGGSTDGPLLTFSAGTATAEVDIVTGSVLLSASPTTFTGDGGRQVQLTLTDSEGNPVEGAIITGTCTVTGTGGSLNITTAPPPTNAQGQAFAIVTASGFNVVTATGPTGTCTFRAGAATATITWASQDTCELFSPQVPTGCPRARLSLTIIGVGTVTSNPSGMVCIGPTAGACLAEWAPQTPVTLQASTAPTSWGGDCAGFGTAQVGTVILGADGSTRTCTVTFP
jgi:hypothetical protein